ncbi:MAG: malate transporter [Proteobacteria bacterium]|nr:malate transporter [Pseudomonadota bacterium]
MEIIQSVLSILLMIGIGVFVAWKMGFDEQNSAGLSKLVIGVTLPAFMISNISVNYSSDSLISMAPGLAVPFASMGICYVLGFLAAKLIRLPENQTGTYTSMFALSNTIFIGLPVNLMLFGAKSIPYVLLFYIANTVLFWTIGVYGISGDGNRSSTRIFSRDNLKRVFSPPLSSFLFAVLCVLAGIKLPELMLSVCNTVGSSTTPLSMIFIGIVLYAVDWKSIRFDKSLVTLIGARFVLAPVVLIVICRFVPLPLLMKQVFVIQASMPIMTQTAIIARTYDADYQYAAVMTSVTTLISLVTIPMYMVIMNHFNIFG